MTRIPFNRPFEAGGELAYIQMALSNNHLSGNGTFTRRCQAWLEEHIGAKKALLTHSCTGALEMGALLAQIHPGDEIIMPSYTFVSTANAFVLRGGVPVFVEIRRDTLNMDESVVEDAIGPRTKAIVPVHYAGVSCEMDVLRPLADDHNLLLIEDAAQAIGSRYHGRPVGADGQLAALSFHETKNVICGEGGALLLNDQGFVERAEIIWEKGTNRSQYFRGEVDKYTWVDIGSSFLPSELNAAFLMAQLEHVDRILGRRLAIWNQYHHRFADLETRGLARRPVVPPHCQHNAHMYYLLVDNLDVRTAMLDHLRSREIQAVFHYVPLHSAPAGERYGRPHGSLSVTSDTSQRLLRLPLSTGMTESETDRVADAVFEFFS